MSVDDSELEDLVRDLGKIGPEAMKKIRPIVSKGANNIKNAMRKDARRSKHFKQLAPTIDYTMSSNNVFGHQIIAAEIGPNKDRGGSAALSGIAYFGTSRPGGGTVRDPVAALGDEEPNFIKHIADLAGDVL